MINVLLFLLGVFLAILPLNTPETKAFLSENIQLVIESVQTTPALDATPAPTVTSAPTPTPLSGPTPTPWMDEAETAALNQKIQDFLNKTGDFTPEKISKMMFDMSGMFDTSRIQLGLVGATFVEGYLLDYVEKDGSLLLLVGFDGNDGGRFVAPIQIPLYYIEGDLTSHFYFLRYYSDKGYAVRSADITQLDTDLLNLQLYNLIGKCIAFSPARIPLSGSKNGYSGRAKTYFNEHNNKVALADKLLLSVSTNEENITVSMTFPQIYDVLNSIDESSLTSLTIPRITELNDINTIDLSGVPMIDPAIYYK